MSLRNVRKVANYSEFEKIAVGVASQNEAVTVLEYAPTAWAVSRVTTTGFDRRWHGRGEIHQSYEARAFGDGFDIRWTRDGDSGQIVAWFDTTRSEVVISGETTDIEVVETLARRYMLWGQIDTQDGKWVTLSDARVGSLSVPADGNGSRAYVTSVEYIGSGSDGNATVVAELLHKFTVEV